MVALFCFPKHVLLIKVMKKKIDVISSTRFRGDDKHIYTLKTIRGSSSEL